ncbi:hypothetical protein QCA50_001046 [Cerrena zonata]|uniref:Uncharacterized protein n=1 Tax=Cerrena zonata TaxID=2478898 RepID=A0AAW0GVY0_9APHY
MMVFSLIPVILSLLIATSHVGAKAATSRLSVTKRGPGCDGLGEGALSDLSSFSLSVPGGTRTYSLVFRDSGKKVGDAIIYALAVRTGSEAIPTFSLGTGALLADGTDRIDIAIGAGEMPGFASNYGEGNHIYCAVPAGTGYALVVNSDRNGFSLCTGTAIPRRFIVYRPSGDHPDVYDVATCRPIEVNIVQSPPSPP